jgi:hypothetical protein
MCGLGWPRGPCPTASALPVLADPELVHARKHPRIFGLEILPQAEIPARIRLRTSRPETADDFGIGDEAENSISFSPTKFAISDNVN